MFPAPPVFFHLQIGAILHPLSLFATVARICINPERFLYKGLMNWEEDLSLIGEKICAVHGPDGTLPVIIQSVKRLGLKMKISMVDPKPEDSPD